ncbi:response regulator [Emcibacter sp.]|uniref:response regulator n=1 Tax=Emcibacter sp. TaxID=1979954 RepID=UPI003A8D067B
MFRRDPKFDNKKVLLVDDDVYLSKIIKSVLDILEVGSVTHVKSVKAGIELFDSKYYDCVIVDCLKNGGKGFELIQAVRGGSDDAKIRTPVILCTAFTEQQNIYRARDMGVNEILAKPVSPDQILLKLNCALYRQREFVQAPGYVGPCRRRRQIDWEGREDRRNPGGAAQGAIPAGNKKEAANG